MYHLVEASAERERTVVGTITKQEKIFFTLKIKNVVGSEVLNALITDCTGLANC